MFLCFSFYVFLAKKQCELSETILNTVEYYLCGKCIFLCRDYILKICISLFENMYFFVETTSWKYVSWKYTCILKIHKNTPSVFIFSLHSWWWWWWQQWWCHPQYLSYSVLHLKQPQKKTNISCRRAFLFISTQI